MMMRDFDIKSFGIDISSVAINEAKRLSMSLNMDMDENFLVFDGVKIPFDNDFFDFTISEGVLDSMPFELAKTLLTEIDRVTQKYFYLSLISSNSTSLFSNLQGDFNGEIEVQEKHENGTIQSFFDKEKIYELIKHTKFSIIFLELIEHTNLLSGIKHGRYHIVLEK